MVRKSIIAIGASLMALTAFSGTVALAILHVAAAQPAAQVAFS